MPALIENMVVIDRGPDLLVGLPLPIPSGGRPVLEALAHANGFETISQWFEWRLNEYEETPKKLVKSVREWLSADRMETVMEILDSAGLHEPAISPWGPDWPGKITEPEFRVKIEEWAMAGPIENVRCREVTAEEADWMRGMAEAALALDGRTARDLGEKILRSWNLLD